MTSWTSRSSVCSRTSPAEPRPPGDDNALITRPGVFTSGFLLREPDRRSLFLGSTVPLFGVDGRGWTGGVEQWSSREGRVESGEGEQWSSGEGKVESGAVEQWSSGEGRVFVCSQTALGAVALGQGFERDGPRGRIAPKGRGGRAVSFRVNASWATARRRPCAGHHTARRRRGESRDPSSPRARRSRHRRRTPSFAIVTVLAKIRAGPLSTHRAKAVRSQPDASISSFRDIV